MSEIQLPDPKYIYHDNGVDGEDDLFEFAVSGAVDVNMDGTPCTNCERLYTAEQVRELVRERDASVAYMLEDILRLFGIPKPDRDEIREQLAAAIRAT